MIEELKKLGEWKIHLAIKSNFMSSKDKDEIMIGNKT